MDYDPQALPPGRVIAGYRIERVLGAGGFGITYAAHNEITEQRVAIKEFFPHGVASRENATKLVYAARNADIVAWALDRFERSTRELCRLKHPNIVEVLNYVRENETGYMIMEYVEGATLDRWLRERGAPPSPAELRPVIEPVLDALAYVHDSGRIHRDIAPDNIMIRPDGRPVLIDFGAVKTIEQRTRTVRTYQVAKANYSPPEQTEDGIDLDRTADIYAVGAVLYCAFAGAPPADAERRKSGVAFRQADPYVPLAGAPGAKLPAGVAATVDRALSFRPAERVQSIGELRAGLGWGAQAIPPEPPPDRPADREAQVKTSFELRDRQEEKTSVVRAPAVAAAAAGVARKDRPWLPYVEIAVGLVLLAGAFILGGLPRRETPPSAPATAPPKTTDASPPVAPAPPPRRDDPFTLPPPVLVAPNARPLSPAEERALRPKGRFKECESCPDMIVVPAGTFAMGSPDSEAGRETSEGPQHRVTIAPFAVGRFAVTFDEWDACAADGGCNKYRPADQKWGRGRQPVINVSWDDAKTYLVWLSTRTGRAYRLLSEAEREYVTRTGAITPYWWGASISTRDANFNGTLTNAKGEYRARTLPVDSFEPNPWGLYQVHGNVWEWVEDCWNDNYKGAPLDQSPWRSGDCSNRVERGGSWSSSSAFLRSAARIKVAATDRSIFKGFRVARTLVP